MKIEQQIIELDIRGETDAANALIDGTPELAALMRREGLSHGEVVDQLRLRNVVPKTRSEGMSIERQLMLLDLRGEFEAIEALIESTPELARLRDRRGLTTDALIVQLKKIHAALKDGD